MLLQENLNVWLYINLLHEYYLYDNSYWVILDFLACMLVMCLINILKLLQIPPPPPPFAGC